MRLVSFESDQGRSYGRIEDGGIAPATRDFRARFPDLRSLLAADALKDLETETTLVAPDSVRWTSPVPNPDKILCVGLNYAAHIKETGRDRPPHPSIFTRYPSSVLGHGAPLLRPHVSDEFDYEGELAVIIGRPGRYIAAADAIDHIAGYTCFNDGTIRDYQRHTSQFWPGKSFDSTGAAGPWMVTADEMGDPAKQHLRTILNGREVQSTPISDLAFSIAEIIAYVSQVTRLSPGDIIATGTPGGVGRFRTPPLYMHAGDVVEVEITGIGTLRNPIAEE